MKDKDLNVCVAGCDKRAFDFVLMCDSEPFNKLGVKLAGICILDKKDSKKLIDFANKNNLSIITNIEELPKLNLDLFFIPDEDFLFQIKDKFIARDLKPYIVEPRTCNLIYKLFETHIEGKKAQKKFYSVFKSARDAIMILDHELNIHQANQAAAKVFGYPTSELLNKNLKDLIPESEKGFYKKIKEGRGEPIIVNAIKKDGTPFPVRASISSFSLNDSLYYTVILRDQTQRKEMEERLLQAERLAAVGQTASYLIHEIKNPLIIIGGFAQQLLKRIDPKDKDKLKIILKEIERLESLITDVRDFTKSIDIERKDCDLNEILLETISFFKDEAAKYGIEIVVDLSKDIPKMKVDPDLMKQVFINLIKNAIEAINEQGTLKIISRLEKSVVKIEISDTGCGISEKYLKEIFNPFFTTKKKGTGLGLTISYRIVKAHGGIIKIRSKEGEGTTCTILLPIK